MEKAHPERFWKTVCLLSLAVGIICGGIGLSLFSAPEPEVKTPIGEMGVPEFQTVREIGTELFKKEPEEKNVQTPVTAPELLILVSLAAVLAGAWALASGRAERHAPMAAGFAGAAGAQALLICEAQYSFLVGSADEALIAYGIFRCFGEFPVPVLAPAALLIAAALGGLADRLVAWRSEIPKKAAKAVAGLGFCEAFLVLFGFLFLCVVASSFGVVVVRKGWFSDSGMLPFFPWRVLVFGQAAAWFLLFRKVFGSMLEKAGTAGLGRAPTVFAVIPAAVGLAAVWLAYPLAWFLFALCGG